MPQDSTNSAFNVALAYLELNTHLLYLAAEQKTRRQLKGWFDSMRTIYGRFKIKFIDKEIKEVDEIELEIKETFKKFPAIDLGETYQVVGWGGRMIDRLNMPEEREDLYMLLSKYEFKILRYADKHGMLLPNKSDPKFAVLNMR